MYTLVIEAWFGEDEIINFPTKKEAFESLFARFPLLGRLGNELSFRQCAGCRVATNLIPEGSTKRCDVYILGPWGEAEDKRPVMWPIQDEEASHE